MFAAIFYLSVGDRIQFRDSNKGIKMAEANNTTIELYKGNIIEQSFTNELDRLEKVGIVCHTYWRENSGTLTIQITKDKNIYASQRINVADIPDQHRVYVYPTSPINGMVGKKCTLKFYDNSLLYLLIYN